MTLELHTFHAKLTWTGAGAAPFEYASYSRAMRVQVPGRQDIEASADVAFVGDPTRHNPEDLILASASICHALTFLAIAARARIEVVSYEDEATAILGPGPDGKYKITEATLRPKVVFAPGTSLERAEAFHTKAHDNCFIARSVNFPIRVEHAHTHREG